MPKKRHLAHGLREAVARSEGLDAAALIAEAREAALAEVRAELARLFADELREGALKALAPQSAVPAGGSTSLVGVVEAGAVPADAEAISIASLRALVVEIEAAELDD